MLEREKDRQEILEFFEKIKNKKASSEELKAFIQFLVFSGKFFKVKPNELNFIDVINNDINVGGSASRYGVVNIKDDLIDKVKSDPENLVELMNTCAHEMTHVGQHDARRKYIKMSDRKKSKVDEKYRKIYFDLDNHENLENNYRKENIIKIIDAFDILNGKKIENRDDLKDLAEIISMQAYYDVSYEQDARLGGLTFINDFIDSLVKSKECSKDMGNWLSMQKDKIVDKLQSEQKLVESMYEKNVFNYKTFRSIIEKMSLKSLANMEKITNTSFVARSQNLSHVEAGKMAEENYMIYNTIISIAFENKTQGDIEKAIIEAANLDRQVLLLKLIDIYNKNSKLSSNGNNSLGFKKQIIDIILNKDANPSTECLIDLLGYDDKKMLLKFAEQTNNISILHAFATHMEFSNMMDFLGTEFSTIGILNNKDKRLQLFAASKAHNITNNYKNSVKDFDYDKEGFDFHKLYLYEDTIEKFNKLFDNKKLKQDLEDINHIKKVAYDKFDEKLGEKTN